MTRAEKIAKAKELRAEGLTYREIGERCGVSTNTPYRWLNPERVAPYRNGRACDPEKARESDRIYNATHRGECERCGGDRPRQSHGPLCEACIANDVDARARRIEQWWADGWTLGEIQGELGWTREHVSVEIHRLREKGYKLPYRYTTGKRAGRKFPEQAAA